MGRAYHLHIATADDLRGVLDLDEAHWVATSAPIDSLHFDPILLQLVDTDHDGRIKSFELKGAIRWCLEVLCDFRGLEDAEASLTLATINTQTADGERARQAANKILARTGAHDTERIALDQVREVRRQLECMPVSEAGIVLPEATDDRTTRQFVEDLLATVGGVDHPSGAEGLDEARLDQFLESAHAYLDWEARGKTGDRSSTDILPLGAATSAAFAAFAGMRDKIDQYFAQCETVKLDDRMAGRITDSVDYNQIDFSDPADLRALLERAPLSRPTAQCTLRFDESINPAYTDSIENLREQVVRPILGNGESITAEQWRQTKQTFAAYEDWSSHQCGAEVAPLGPEKIRQYLDAGTADAVRDLIAHRKETAFVLDNIRVLEKLVLFQANLVSLANNFISFPDLYNPKRRAAFEMGTAIMDGRRFNLAIAVRDRAAHANIASNSNLCVMYLDLTQQGSDKHCVAVPVTSGGRGNLFVGKRGIFEDIHGGQWDAQIVQIIENPIGFGAAIVAPYRRIAKMFTGKIESLTSSAEKKFDERAEQSMSAVTTAGKQPTAPQGPAGSRMAAGGMLMGGGLAVAAILSAVAYVGKVVVENPLAILLGVVGALLVLMLPTTILAFLKLRKRDLSAILEATGWAINTRMRLTKRQALTFTERPPYPEGARGVRHVAGWLIALLIFVVIAAAVAWRLMDVWLASR